ncbi:MAG: extracellular solute-binding protein, partial [Pseudomonadota bacterium]
KTHRQLPRMSSPHMATAGSAVRGRPCAAPLGHAVIASAMLMIAVLTALVTTSSTAALAAKDLRWEHAIAMHGAPKYAADFTHFATVNPDAPKGGTLTLGAYGTFDSLNPLIINGRSAAGIRGMVYESLLTRAPDEPFTLYGHLAGEIAVAPDRRWIAFRMDPRARFADGKPVTVDDVIFSHALLRDRGRPNHRSYYAKVVRVERLDDTAVRFVLADETTPAAEIDRELPLILGLMPILPKHAVDTATFEDTTLTPPIGSGPYAVGKVETGVQIVYQRRDDYWARDSASQRGRHNFDRVTYDYYRDTNALFEAFKTGLIDVRFEGDPARWSEQFDFPAVADGRITKREIALQVPAGMNALAMNTRRAPFDDIRVREALITLFDFEWINRNLFRGIYTRTQSFFARSELSSHGKPAAALERALFAKFPGAVPGPLLDGSFALPRSNGSGRDRALQRKAIGLLREAGYELRGRQMVDGATGTPLTFRMHAVTPAQERLFLAFQRSLRAVGIEAVVRQIDTARAERNMKTFDFDIAQFRWFASLSPGNEQSFRWSSAQADNPASFNFAGVRSPAVDAAIESLLAQRDRPDFVAAVHALDRALLAGHYVIPLYHLQSQWFAHWAHIQLPQTPALSGTQRDSWWSAKADTGAQ